MRLLFLAALCSQIHSMDIPTSTNLVFGNKDIMQNHIILHSTIYSLPQLKRVCKNFHKWTGDIKEIVYAHLEQDYVLFWDFYYPSFGPQANTIALDNTHPKIQLLDKLLIIHRESIESDIMYYLKSLYISVRDNANISNDSMKSFVLGKDLPIESRLMFKGFVNETHIYTDNNYGAMLRLLDKDAKINEKNMQEQLTATSHKGHLSTLEALLKRRADANMSDELNSTPFDSACAGYHFSKACQKHQEYSDQQLIKIINVLLKYGLEIKQPKKLIEAVLAYGCVFLLPILFQKGLDPNLRMSKKNTLIHLLCYRKDFDGMKSCIKYGVFINERDKYGDTPLHDIIAKISFRKQDEPLDLKAMEITELLLKNNADVNAQNKKGITVLDLINYRKPVDKELKDLLLKHGAKTSFQLFFTKLRWAIMCATGILTLIMYNYIFYWDY